MPDKIKIFISYSHQDAGYLEENSLLGFLKGLEKENIEFWTDRSIRPGELWDEVIKIQINVSHIALVLVSQGFLDSDYCQNIEIKHFLASKAHLFPVILSPCDWHRHAWLKNRQFLPGGEQTVEENFQDSGCRKRLFLQIREQLRERANLIRQNRCRGSIPLSLYPNSPDGNAIDSIRFAFSKLAETLMRILSILVASIVITLMLRIVLPLPYDYGDKKIDSLFAISFLIVLIIFLVRRAIQSKKSKKL
jgi:hypothetical protein